ncbi:hypothetical protein FOZ62_029641 [Perkinsus olseni]|uniref:Uncharacterized protein n=2 Tax=Perkinsus olseni TaxID=32597 RepID=A0A7J6Q2U1_PEROL|nr:hypothetical protein FOZ62_029641 [Perkinsus olseni]
MALASSSPLQERACVNLAAISLWRPFQDSSRRLLDRTPYALSILEYCKVSPGHHCIARTLAKGCIQDLDSSVCVTKDSQHLVIVDSVRLEIREVPLKAMDSGEVHVTRIRRLSREDTNEVATSTIEEWRESRLISKLTSMCFSICIDQSLNEVLITHPRGVTEQEQRERIIAVSLVDPGSTQVLDTTRLNLGYCIPAIKYSSKTGFIYILDHENSSLLCTRRAGKELRLLSVRSMYRSKIGEFVLRLSLPEDFDVFTDKEGQECIVVADTDNKRIILWRGDDPVGEDLTGRMRGEPISVEVDTSRRFGAGRGPRAYFGMLPNNTLCELDLDATEATPRSDVHC